MNLGVLKLILIILFLSFPSLSEPLEGYSVDIQILDKITAKVKTLEVKVNSFTKFQSLKIEVYTCFKNPPDQVPENYVLLKIFDEIDKSNSKLIYQGWMISSSPASTPLEHPIYDLWLKNCIIKKDF